MPINPDAVGTTSDPGEATWDSKDCLLYALGVGAGMTDPTGFELEFTTENSEGIDQKALPTMPVVRLMITPGHAALIASITLCATSGSHDGRWPMPGRWSRRCTCMIAAPALNASRASLAICAGVTGTGCCLGSVSTPVTRP